LSKKRSVGSANDYGVFNVYFADNVYFAEYFNILASTNACFDYNLLSHIFAIYWVNERAGFSQYQGVSGNDSGFMIFTMGQGYSDRTSNSKIATV
jgi:hypothetical protein